MHKSRDALVCEWALPYYLTSLYRPLHWSWTNFIFPTWHECPCISETPVSRLLEVKSPLAPKCSMFPIRSTPDADVESYCNMWLQWETGIAVIMCLVTQSSSFGYQIYQSSVAEPSTQSASSDQKFERVKTMFEVYKKNMYNMCAIQN
jgi:hypothetical protein